MYWAFTRIPFSKQLFCGFLLLSIYNRETVYIFLLLLQFSVQGVESMLPQVLLVDDNVQCGGAY
uniref:Uncharacterized protein n=1 Tax=Arundo donax TaxID=35708 RepID=A0A0A8Z5Y4_ARUDO